MSTATGHDHQGSWLHRNVLGFGIASLFSDFGHEIVTSLMPGFLVSIGAPAIALGLMEGVSNAIQSAAKLWGGRMADRLERTRPWLVGGYALTAAKALIALTGSWPLIVIIRSVAWAGRGSRGPVRDYLMSRSVDRAVYGRAFGFREALDTLGALLGPLAAYVFLSHFGYRPLIGFTAVPSLLAAVAIVIFIRDIPGVRREVSSAGGFGEVWLAFGRSIRAFFVFSLANLAPTFFILRATLLLTPSHGAIQAAALGVGLYAIHNLTYALAAFPAGALADRIGAARTLRIGYVVFALALGAYALAGSDLALLPIGFVLSGAATSTVESLQSAAVAHALPEEQRGHGLGLQAGLTGFGNLISNLLVGAAFTLSAATPAFLLLAAIALVGAGLLHPPGRTVRS